MQLQQEISFSPFQGSVVNSIINVNCLITKNNRCVLSKVPQQCKMLVDITQQQKTKLIESVNWKRKKKGHNP